MQVNLDANASYGLLPEVFEGLRDLPPTLLNPNSVHAAGQAARALLQESREHVAALLHLSRAEGRVVFTSGATESNNTALLLPFWNDLGQLGREHDNDKGAHCIITEIEHPSVLETAHRLESFGAIVKTIPVMRDGKVAIEQLLNALGENTKIVSVMLANNETGQILNLAEVSQKVRERKPDVLIHSDAVQAAGKIPVSFSELGVDLLSLSAHKMGGLIGSGALVVRSGVPCKALVVGGAQEQRWRSGTENTWGIVSFGLAAKVAHQDLLHRSGRMEKGRDYLLKEMVNRIPGVTINVAGGALLPNTLSLRIKGIHADDLVVALDLEGVMVSSGAACSSGKPLPSHVLLGLGLSEDEARQTLRISLRGDWREEELDYVLEKLGSCVERMRQA